MLNSPTQEHANSSVRRLAAGDLERVVAIDQEIGGRSRRGFFENRLAASLAEPSAFISLAFVENGAVEGHVLAHMLDGEFGVRHPVAVLDAIGTSPSARGHGGAQALMRELKNAARGRGAHALRTQVSWSNEPMKRFVAAAGFKLASSIVLDRPCGGAVGDGRSGELGGDAGQDLWQDRIPARALTIADVPSVVRIDRQITGLDRSIYYKRKAREALRKNGVRLSMVAEISGAPAGFIMARVDYGGFGVTEVEAVMDTIGVDPEFAGQHVGTILFVQLLSQLMNLRIERVRTLVEWNNVALIGFLERLGFKPTQDLTLSLAL